ncbi:MAG: hypothetical protein ACIAQF_09610, partial [Phycisphaerales bacterium JB065]
FMGKLFLFASGISAGEITLVVIMALNSAIGAYYYLRLAFFPMLETRDENAEPMKVSPYRSRAIASMLSAGGVLVLIPFTQTLWTQAETAATYTGAGSVVAEVDTALPIETEDAIIEPASAVSSR